MIVKIESPNMGDRKAGTSRGTVITTHDGHAIHGVTKATMHLEPNKVITADLVIHAAVRASAEAKFSIIDPKSGELKPISSIEFEDGTIFETEPELCQICRAPATERFWTTLKLAPERDDEGHLTLRLVKDREHHLCAECASNQ